jgi:FkbM family methyltransferase
VSITAQLKNVVRPIMERFPKVATAYRSARDGLQIYEAPKATPMGFRMVGNHMMQTGEFEVTEVSFVKQLFKHTNVFINVGANVGFYCCHALQNNKRVVAFEPLQSNLIQLYQNIKNNGWEHKIEIFPLALSDNCGLLHIYGSGTGASLIEGWAGVSNQFFTMIPVSTLDTVLGTRFQKEDCLLLIDIEGAEYHMLHGATNFLKRTPKPIWIVEIQTTNHQPEGITINPNFYNTFSIFWDAGYEAWTVEQQSRFINRDEVKAIEKTHIDTLKVHNFLFIEPGKKDKFLQEQSA